MCLVMKKFSEICSDGCYYFYLHVEWESTQMKVQQDAYGIGKNGDLENLNSVLKLNWMLSFYDLPGMHLIESLIF